MPYEIKDAERAKLIIRVQYDLVVRLSIHFPFTCVASLVRAQMVISFLISVAGGLLTTNAPPPSRFPPSSPLPTFKSLNHLL